MIRREECIEEVVESLSLFPSLASLRRKNNILLKMSISQSRSDEGLTLETSAL